MNKTINSIYLLRRIVWDISLPRQKIKILFVLFFSIISSILQYLNIILTALTFSYITSLAYSSSTTLELDLFFGNIINLQYYSLSEIIFIWLLASLITSSSVILSSFLIYKVAYGLGKNLSKINLKMAINSNSIFYEKHSEKTLFNLLTAENQMLIKGPIMALIGLPMQIAIIVLLSSIIINNSGPIFLIILPGITLLYLTFTNLFLKIVRKNSEEVFNLRSDQTDILSRIIGNYLDVAFPPSGENYINIFSKTTTKLRNLEAYNATVPRVLKVILEFLIILIIGFYIIYNIQFLNQPLEIFISSSAAIIISVFKLSPIISGFSSSLIAFGDKYESIKKFHSLLFNSYKYNLYSGEYNYSQILLKDKYALKIESLKNERIVKFSKKESLNLFIETKKLLWITGQSGCGKSTLLSMIAGIRPIEKGKIQLILDKDKMDKASRYMHENLSYMPQKPIFHSTKIIDYIKDGDFIIKDQDIKDIINKLKIPNTFQMNADDLLNTVIGAKGYKPSGGQAKLLAFVRTVSKRNVHMYLLDEPTSDLNKELKEIVLNSIYELSKNKLVLCITHDLDAIRSEDEILFL